jgi:hypothetical protein
VLRPPLRRAAAVVAALVLGLTLAACGGDDDGSAVDPDQVDAVRAPENGACRELVPEDISRPSNATAVVGCDEPHTAETYAVGELPSELEDAAYDDARLGEVAYETCAARFQEFLGADESTVMRSVVSWAWFRPSEKAWDEGARWYRCDAVGGGEQSSELLDLPAGADGLLAGKPDDQWMVCVNGASVQTAEKIPCTEKHNWRAVTTIKAGDAGDPYPGDRAVQQTTREYCSSSVAAWLGYPAEYDFGFTWFHQPEWDAGNRRSICWAATAA